MNTPHPSKQFCIGMLALVLSALMSASCANGYDPDEFRDAPRPRDARSMDTMADTRVDAPVDTGRSDSGPVLCSGIRCTTWQYCDGGGVCRDYPLCGDAGPCAAGSICRNGRCIPGTVDIDGDGSPAAMDCDESDPLRNPGAAERCNGADDNCNARVDDGDTSAMCAMSPMGGECIMGMCTCPSGRFDIDRTMPGCECAASPPVTDGMSCSSPIDVGNVSDTGQMMVVMGNAMPMDRAVWYRFNGVDAADTTCDNLHVRVQFRTNPGNQFEFTVFRGECTANTCADMGYTDFSWSTDFTGMVGGMLAGQCPCTAAGAPMDNVSVCSDDSAPYFIRVRRKAPAMATCDSYAIEISNGVYDTAP